MSLNLGDLDRWRRFFQGANSSIFEIIEQEIGVPAVDHAKEFWLLQSRIDKKLFSQHLNGCTCSHQTDEFDQMRITDKSRSNHDNFIDMLQCGHTGGYYDKENRLDSTK
ncbi:hypothetical protein TorRG33x02_035580, partial [Trema orientale]